MTAAGFPSAPPPPPGRITFVSANGRQFTGILNGPPEELDIDVGLDDIERPKRKGAIDWTGSKPGGWAVPVLFDEWRGDGNAEGALGNLTGMAKVPDNEDTAIKVRVLGISQISGATNTREWFIRSVAFADDPKPIWRGTLRVRQAVVITIVEAIVADQIKVRPAQAARDRNGNAKTRTYTVKKGDTLQRIAVQQLGSAGRWREIADLNKIRDPKKIKVGQKLKLPK